MIADVPGAPILLGTQAGTALAALVGEGGSRLVSYRPAQVVYRPGRRLAVVYDAVIDEGVQRSLVLHTGRGGPEGGAVVDAGGLRIKGWALPLDPDLPGLPMWFDRAARTRLLADVGISGPGTMRLRSYRPAKRAVLEISAPPHRVFVKVVRPTAVENLQTLHALLGQTMPIPRTLGWMPEHGAIVLEGLAGSPLAGSDWAPSAESMTALLDLIPPTHATVSPRKSRVAGHAAVLERLLPERSADLREVVEAAEGIPDDPVVPVHGDFHSGQVMVDDGRITGLVDIDTVGMGARADDLANLLAHLHAVALGASPAAARIGERLLAGFDPIVAPGPLRLRIAGTLLGYAPGPWLRQSPGWRSEVASRLDAALAWKRAAGPVS